MDKFNRFADTYAMKIALRVTVAVSVLLSFLDGQTKGEPKIGKSTPKEFKVEMVTYYNEAPYDPAYVVSAVPRDRADYSTPENCFITQFSAMLRGDYAQFSEGFTNDSKIDNEKTASSSHLSPDDWKKIWERRFRGERVEMLKRIETGPYVIVQYDLRNETTGKQDFEGLLPMRIESGKWLQTQELANDGFFVHFLDPQKPVVEIVRQPVVHADR